MKFLIITDCLSPVSLMEWITSRLVHAHAHNSLSDEYIAEPPNNGHVWDPLFSGHFVQRGCPLFEVKNMLEP